MPADPTSHLIIPFAQCNGDEWLDAMPSIELKNLGYLLRGMKLTSTDVGKATSMSTPHDRALAKARGLPTGVDGLIPWAANEANANLDEGWAYITPCHWAMGREHATLTDPATLKLPEADSRTLLATMQPYFATEGITLHYAAPTRWLANGDVFASLPTASLDRVLGRNVDRWLPASKAMKLLQNEMQMLLYTHPVNDLRAAIGKRSVNSFWISGSGALTEPAPNHPHVNVAKALVQPAVANDWAAYTAAWALLDANEIAQLLSQQSNKKAVSLSLCGESNALTFKTAQHNFITRFQNVLSPQRPIYLLKQL